MFLKKINRQKIKKIPKKNSQKINRQPSNDLKFNRQPSKGLIFKRQPSKGRPPSPPPSHWDPFIWETLLWCLFLSSLSDEPHHEDKIQCINSPQENKTEYFYRQQNNSVIFFYNFILHANIIL